MTRNRKMVSSTYPELVEALGAQQSGDFVVDGEVVAFSDGQTRFAQLQQRMQIGRPSAELLRTVPVQYYLFDVLWADGTDLRPRAAAGTQAAAAPAAGLRRPAALH